MKHYLGICLVLVTLTALTLFTINRCTDATAMAVGHVRDAFDSVLQVQPKITVNERVVETQTAPIAELAIVSKEELVTVGFDEHKEFLSYSIPLTGKKLSVDGTYRLKAGFDLHEPIEVAVDPVTHVIMASLPPPKILSVEQVGDVTYHGEDSLLNRLSDQERSDLINSLYKTARQAAEDSTLKQDAANQVQQRLQQILAHNGEKFELRWSKSDTNTKSFLP